MSVGRLRSVGVIRGPRWMQFFSLTYRHQAGRQYWLSRLYRNWKYGRRREIGTLSEHSDGPLRSEAQEVVREAPGTAAEELRRHPRYQVQWPANCIDGSGRNWSTIVVDTSVGGLGLKSCPPLVIDDVVRVQLADIGEFHCRVAWSGGNRCGIEFIDWLEQDDIDALCTVIKQIAS